MKFDINKVLEWVFILLIITLLVNIDLINSKNLKVHKKNTFLNVINNENPTNDTLFQNEFPIMIDLNFNKTLDNINLHLKRFHEGKIMNNSSDIIFRIDNETIFTSQTMMIEKLVSGNYILYGEKFSSFKSLSDARPYVNIYSEKISYFNITCPIEKFDTVNWTLPIFWEIGVFRFSSSSFKFQNFNFLTNEIRLK